MSEALRTILALLGNVLGYGIPAIAGISLAVVFVREWRKASQP
jgi:hypothetical protein